MFPRGDGRSRVCFRVFGNDGVQTCSEETVAMDQTYTHVSGLWKKSLDQMNQISMYIDNVGDSSVVCCANDPMRF